jgi:hypothetical protein
VYRNSEARPVQYDGPPPTIETVGGPHLPHIFLQERSGQPVAVPRGVPSVRRSVKPVAAVTVTSISGRKTIGEAMTTKSNFSVQEWQVIVWLRHDEVARPPT